MFKVVEFYDDDGYGGELGVVREEWLTPRKSRCMWPPYKTANKFNKCLSSNEAPNKITWTLCPIKRLFYETGKFFLCSYLTSYNPCELRINSNVLGLGNIYKRFVPTTSYFVL